MGRQYYVYMMTNRHNNVLYTGVTNDLLRRAHEHRSGEFDGFTSKYKINKLVYFEVYENVTDAIVREKQIKDGPRKKKLRLIDGMNEDWMDLTYCI